MKGVPDVLRTREDFVNVRQAVLEGKLPTRQAQRVLTHWEGLLSRWRYVYDRDLDDGEAPDGDEPAYRVLRSAADDGAAVRQQYRREEDPGARITRLGLTVEEVESAITAIEGAIHA